MLATNGLSIPPPRWFPEPGTITLEARRANRYVRGFVEDYFKRHNGVRADPRRAALRISEDYGVDACEAILIIYRILNE